MARGPEHARRDGRRNFFIDAKTFADRTKKGPGLFSSGPFQLEVRVLNFY
jgi:hypothetical protein